MKVRLPRERLITLLATVLPAAGRQAGTILSHVHLTIDNLGRLLGQGDVRADQAETPFSVDTLPAQRRNRVLARKR